MSFFVIKTSWKKLFTKNKIYVIRKYEIKTRGGIILKNGIKTLAMWLIIGVIFIVVLSSIVENSESKLQYSELITNINEGNVEAIQIEADGTTATVELKDDKIKAVGDDFKDIESGISDKLEVVKTKQDEVIETIKGVNNNVEKLNQFIKK